MITIACIDETGAYEISVKSYDMIMFKKNLDKEEYYVLFNSEGVWHRVCKEDFESHLEESEIEDTSLPEYEPKTFVDCGLELDNEIGNYWFNSAKEDNPDWEALKNKVDDWWHLEPGGFVTNPYESET